MKNAQAPVQRTDIAIVGMSALFPKAHSLKSFWKILRLGTDTITDIPASHWSPDDYFDENQKAPDMTYCRRGGFLDPYPFDPTEFSMPPTALEATDTSQLLGLVAAKAALEDAGYGADREFNRGMTSVILGVTGTLELVVPLGARLGHPYWKKALQESGLGPELVEEVMARISADYVPWQENSFPGLLGNVVAGRIANRLDLHGTNCVVDAACASTLSAAHLAFLELQTGQADMVITGGTDTFNDIFMYMCFSKTPALSASGKIRPFDADSDGTLIGEGLGMVVLKRLADAEKDGDKIYAVIRGVGTASDGKGGAVYAPISHGQARALRRAYENAGVSPRTVELVEAHGTGTKVGDVVEFEGLKSVYAEASPDKGWCALGSVKSQIGHTKAAAGSASLIKAAMALHHKIFPPTINVNKPNPKLGIEDSAFYINNISRPWVSHPDHPRRAGLSSFGFGGSNFHLVLEEYGSQRTEVAWDGSVEIAAFSGASSDEVAQKLRAALADQRSLAVVAHESRASFRSADAHRLLVPATVEDMPGALQAALDKLQKAEVWDLSGHSAVAGKTAYLFPGQGSQYVDMGRELACLFPEMLESLEATGRDIAQAIYPAPVYDKALESAHTDYLTSTDRAQPALGVMERGYFHLLERFGLKPEGTAGHSYGELAALYAAGVIDGEGLVELSRERGRLMASQGSDLGTMMAVKGTLEKVEQVLAESGTSVVLANRNSPDQCVLSGSAKDFEALAPVLKKAGLKGIPLKVGAAFHSSFVAGARDPFHKLAGKVKFNKSEIPVYANKTAELYPAAGKAARAMLADQLVHQVNFVGLIERMYNDGFRTFIEVGPKSVLTGLVKAILKDKSDVKVVPLDRSAGKKSGLLDLATALCELAAAGCPVDLAAWEEMPPAESKRRMTVPISGANYRAAAGKKPPVREPNSVGAKSAQPALASVQAPASVPAAKAANPVSTVSLASQSGPAAAKPPAAPVAPPRPVSQPVAAPAATAPVATVAAAPAGLQSLLPHFEALQELSRQTAQVHQQFLKSQEAAQSALGQLLAGQGVSGSAPALARQSPPAPPAPVAAVSAPRPVPAPVAVPASPAPVAVSAPVAVKASQVRPHTPAIGPVASPVDQVLKGGGADDSVSKALLKVVADKTGYPQEMLNLDMDLEADLGIDSIKRVEILAAVEEAVPGLPKVDSDRLGALRTLGEIVTAMTPAGGLPATASAAAKAPPLSAAPPSSSGSASAVSGALLKVVADKTGYPAEMLTLDMDLEADLGIDSIKRVEILAAVEDAVPGLPKVDSDRLGSLRTLGEIVTAMTPAGGMPAAASAAAQAPTLSATSSSGSASAVSGALLKVVADKTGYPAEMLTLDMDLEADLGIDSIKRVEILAAVEDAVPGLPKVDSDRLGSLRTLGEIVAAMTPAGQDLAQVVSAAPAPSGGDAVSGALLKVVAEKTGYPVDMLTLDMDLESDLGIDSIKRVEILASVEEALPGLPKVDSDRLGSLHTLGEIVAAMTPAGGHQAASQPHHPPAPPMGLGATGVARALLRVVAEKTGYPADMLTLDMDLEADLGIDSIKRVEILASVEDAMPGLPKVEADRLGSLRTLGEIVEVMTPAGDLQPHLSSPAPLDPGASAGVTGALLAVVAEKTGYPQDMLTLDMDLESDLGIDSIKRVEILASVEEAMPGLPKVDADRLGSLRTLGEIVTAMTPAHGAVASPTVQVATPLETAIPTVTKTISRQCLQLIDLGPGQASGLPLPEGTVLAIAEDAPGLGQELLAALKALGVEAVLMGDEPLPGNLGTLVLVGNGGDGQRSRDFLLKAFQRTREAAPALRRTGGALFTVTTLDGSFGMKGKSFDPFIGGLAGLPKTIAHEWPEVFTRAIDRSPEVTVETVLEELMKDGPVEVALSPGRRETLVTAPAQAVAGTPHLGPDDVVLVTGGARGVTAACAIATARAYQAKFVLMGRTPLEGPDFDLYPGISDEGALKREIMQRQFGGKATPKDLQRVANQVAAQREMQATLAALSAAGVQACYLACDVRDQAGLEQGLAQAQQQLGPITTLIHGAGVLADRKIEDKTDEQFQSVFSTKVESLLILNKLLPDLKSMLFFSSVTARFGRPGQVDYCMANEVLNKFAQLESRRRPRCHIVAMGWGPWAGGMVTPSLAREFERIGVGLIPIEAGAQAVVDELSHRGAGQAEVLFGDGFPEPVSPKSKASQAAVSGGGGGELLLQKTLSVAALPFLESHKLKSQPVLPMAFMLEWFVQGAMQSGAGMRLIGVDDLRVFRGATISGGVEPTLAVSVVSTSVAKETGHTHWTLELRDIGRNILHARGTVILGDSQPTSPAAQALNGLASRSYGYAPEAIYSELLFHGPDFHAVGEVSGISDGGLVASLKSAGKPSEWEREPLRSDWATEPLVIDGVLQLGILWCWESMGKPSLPNGFAHYRQYVNRFPKSGVRAALRVVSHTDRSLVADCELLDSKGAILGHFQRLEWTADEALKAAFGLSGALAPR
jgi:acyl transferase domain-containing protein/NAD(P)-dependent dehydrogenase (short-subunit alcohol dehydrogenase family)